MSDERQRPAATQRDAIVRHGKLTPARAWKSILAVVAGSLAVVLVAGASVAGIALWQLQSQIETVEIDFDAGGAPVSIASFEGGFNILIVGSDTREGQGDAFGRETSVLNDVNMLLHVAEDQRSAVLVSLPRDMVVPMPRCEDGGPATGVPINNTLFYGGLACTVLTVQELTGLDIQFAGMVTFNGVINMSNALGGVEICTDGPIDDPYTGLSIPGAGRWTLMGADALAFLRSRHGVGDGSDLGRISSQQVFLSSLVRQIKSDDTLTDFGKLYGLAQAATANMTLSEGFARVDTLVSIALVLKDIPLDNIVMVQYPSRTGGTGIYEGKVQPITSTATALFDAISADVPIGLDPNSVGANGGATLDPNAPVPTPGASGSPTDAPVDTTVITGLRGQTAAQYTCSVAN